MYLSLNVRLSFFDEGKIKGRIRRNDYSYRYGAPRYVGISNKTMSI